MRKTGIGPVIAVVLAGALAPVGLRGAAAPARGAERTRTDAVDLLPSDYVIGPKDVLGILVWGEDALSLDVIDHAVVVKRIGDCVKPIGEEVQVDIAPGAHVAGHDAANQARAVARKKSHDSERFEAHLAEVFVPLIAFV